MARGVKGMWPDGRRAALADDLLDLAAHGLERDAEGLERLGGDALALVDEPEQDVLGADVVVVEEARLFLRQDDDSAGPVGEPFEQGAASHAGRIRGSSVPVGPPPALAAVRRRSGRPVRRAVRRRDARRQPGSVARTGASRLAVCVVAAASPLLALPDMAADLGRVEEALRAVGARPSDAVPHRGRQPPHPGRRQAAPARRCAVAGGPARGEPAPRHRRGRPRAAVSVELVHLGSLYHDDVMDEADDPAHRRERERPVGQPPGHPRRRLPAGPGVGDRRLARHRGGRPAGRHHRPAVRGPGRASCSTPTTSTRTEDAYLASIERQDGVAVRHRVPHRRHRRRACPGRTSTR